MDQLSTEYVISFFLILVGIKEMKETEQFMVKKLPEATFIRSLLISKLTITILLTSMEKLRRSSNKLINSQFLFGQMNFNLPKFKN